MKNIEQSTQVLREEYRLISDGNNYYAAFGSGRRYPCRKSSQAKQA